MNNTELVHLWNASYALLMAYELYQNWNVVLLVADYEPRFESYVYFQYPLEPIFHTA